MVPTGSNSPISFDAVRSTAQPIAVERSKPVDSPEEQKLKKAAGDFESILLASMWKGMKESFGNSDMDNDADPAHGTLEDWGIEIMSGAVGKAGGLGIGKMILQHLEPTLEAQSTQSPSLASPVMGITAPKTK